MLRRRKRRRRTDSARSQGEVLHSAQRTSHKHSEVSTIEHRLCIRAGGLRRGGSAWRILRHIGCRYLRFSRRVPVMQDGLM